jgi:CO/xanthine dehydrogenase FAD-binding subunit
LPISTQAAESPVFSYVRAESLDHALEVLSSAADDVKVLAGGQSLLPVIAMGLARPDRLLDIGRIDSLGGIAGDDGRVSAGPLVRHRDLEHLSGELALAAPLLPLAAARIGHTAIRERGTFGGSLAHADPAAEWPAVALALGATIVLRSTGGERRVSAEDLFLGPLTTCIEPDELIVAVEWSAAPRRTGASVEELTYRHGDYAVVGVAAQLSLDSDDAIADARLSLFGVGGTPIRAREAESLLVSHGLEGLDDAAAEAARVADPATDATASASYRREMVSVFTRRAVTAAHGRALDAHRDGSIELRDGSIEMNDQELQRVPVAR